MFKSNTDQYWENLDPTQDSHNTLSNSHRTAVVCTLRHLHALRSVCDVWEILFLLWLHLQLYPLDVYLFNMSICCFSQCAHNCWNHRVSWKGHSTPKFKKNKGIYVEFGSAVTNMGVENPLFCRNFGGFWGMPSVYKHISIHLESMAALLCLSSCKNFDTL